VLGDGTPKGDGFGAAPKGEALWPLLPKRLVVGAAPNGVWFVAAPNGTGPLLNGVGVGAIPPPKMEEELVVAPNGEELGAIPPPKGVGLGAMPPPNGMGLRAMPPPNGDVLGAPPNGVGPPPNGDVLGALPKGVGAGAGFNPNADVSPKGELPKAEVPPNGVGAGAATPNGEGAGLEPKVDIGAFDPNWLVVPPNGEDVDFGAPNGLCPMPVEVPWAPNGPPSVFCDDPNGD
jgi:hypothetical protein